MLIEAAKGGHTTVVQMLIDYPNSLVTPTVVEQVEKMIIDDYFYDDYYLDDYNDKMLSSMLTCPILRAGACCRSPRVVCRPPAVRAGAGQAPPSPS